MALCATTALAGAVSRLCVRGARGRFGGFWAGPWCCVSPSSPFAPRVFRAACGGPSRPGVPYPRSTPAERSLAGRSPQPHSNPGKGRGGQLKHMTETPPSKGKGARNLFYGRPTDDKGGPCHAPDCHGRSACMLQLKRTQKTKDGQEVKHQDHFGCTITCGYCAKRRHSEDECHIKRRESKKHKKAEEERRNIAGKGGGGGGANPGRFKGKGNAGGGQTSSAHPTGGRGAPNPTSKGEPSGEKQPAPSTPSASGADKSSENAKKRRPNWHSKCLQAAGVEVKFPEEG